MISIRTGSLETSLETSQNSDRLFTLQGCYATLHVALLEIEMPIGPTSLDKPTRVILHAPPVKGRQL